MHTDKVGIVILNYKGWKDTLECLESVFKLDYTNYEVIVVDNFSGNGSVEKIELWAEGNLEVANVNPSFNAIVFPLIPKPVAFQKIKAEDCVKTIKSSKIKLTIIENSQNSGYAAGNNIGISYLQQQDYEYLWLLNNDTVVDPQSLNSLLKSFKGSKRKVGIAGSRLLFYNQPAIIQNIGAEYNKWLASTKEYGSQETDHGQYPDDKEVGLVQGASMFVSKQFINEVGLLAEDYFLYYEEIDWSIRAHRQGYICLYSAESKVYHKAGVSTGATDNKDQKSYLSDYYYLKNKIVITKKFYPYCLFTVYLSFIIAALNRIKRKQFNRLPLILKIMIKS